MNVIEDYNLMIQRRKHRKKRISKKWLKKYGSFPDPRLYFVGGTTVIGHPASLKGIARDLKSKGQCYL